MPLYVIRQGKFGDLYNDLLSLPSAAGDILHVKAPIEMEGSHGFYAILMADADNVGNAGSTGDVNTGDAGKSDKSTSSTDSSNAVVDNTNDTHNFSSGYSEGPKSKKENCDDKGNSINFRSKGVLEDKKYMPMIDVNGDKVRADVLPRYQMSDFSLKSGGLVDSLRTLHVNGDVSSMPTQPTPGPRHLQNVRSLQTAQSLRMDRLAFKKKHRVWPKFVRTRNSGETVDTLGENGGLISADFSDFSDTFSDGDNAVGNLSRNLRQMERKRILKKKGSGR